MIGLADRDDDRVEKRFRCRSALVSAATVQLDRFLDGPDRNVGARVRLDLRCRVAAGSTVGRRVAGRGSGVGVAVGSTVGATSGVGVAVGSTVGATSGVGRRVVRSVRRSARLPASASACARVGSTVGATSGVGVAVGSTVGAASGVGVVPGPRPANRKPERFPASELQSGREADPAAASLQVSALSRPSLPFRQTDQVRCARRGRRSCR
ncbi:MAG: hypothetical protein IPK58_10270 [Acidobacteria bacterium]|nr:hypothetical protein [Acidobacteriota bacterium]